MNKVRISGREYTVTVLPALDEGKPVYVLTGKKGAKYFTVRNRPNPDLMFVLPEKQASGPNHTMRSVWLTDRRGQIEQVR